MAITQNHVINIQPGVSAPLVIHCSQGDTGTQINLTVVNGDEVFDCSSYACSVHGVRSDGGNWGPITCTVSGSTVCFSLTSAMTAVAGACLAEISVGTVGTANFAMLMENATFGNGVTYSNDVSVYQNILNAVQAEKNERIHADNSLSSRIFQNDARINNLVGNTGNSNSEIVDARVGADGVTYDTLGTAIRTQVGELNDDIEYLNGEIVKINHITGSYKYDIFNNFIVGASIYDDTNVSGAMYAISPIIKVKSGDVLRLRTFYGNIAKYAFSDVNGKVISSGNLIDSNYKILDTKISDNILNVPTGAKYFRFTGRKVSADSGETIDIKDFSIVTFNRELPSKYISPSKIEMPNLLYASNQWRDKICACLGSSLTANGGWTDIIKERFSFSKMYNRGVGGTTLSDFSNYSGIKNYVGGKNIYTDTENYDESRESVFCDDTSATTRPYQYRVGAWYSSEMRINLLPMDADLVIVDLATNDFYRSYNQSYVTQEDFLKDEVIKTVYRESLSHFNYDGTKLFGAFMLMVRRIMSRCPKAKIVVWGMLYNATITSNDSESLDYYIKMIDKIKYLCRLTGVYFIDTMSEMGVNVWNSANIIQDGVHPYKDTFTNETGKKLVGDVLIGHIQKLYPIN